MSAIPHYCTLSIANTGIAQLVNLTPPAFERESVEQYALGDTVKSYRPSRVSDNGEFEATVMYNPAVHGVFTTLSNSPNNSPIVITFPTYATCSFSGHMTSFEPDEVSREDEDNLQATITMKVSSPIVWASI
jgi:hypothetical protein